MDRTRRPPPVSRAAATASATLAAVRAATSGLTGPAAESPSARAHASAAVARIGPAAACSAADRDDLAASNACGARWTCTARVMRVHGASAAAGRFFLRTGRYVVAFAGPGPVHVGDTLLPTPSNHMAGFLLLNGALPFLTPPLVSLAAPATDAFRGAYRRRDPPTGLHAWADSVGPWVEGGRTLASDGTEVLVQFPLYAGSANGGTPYGVRVAEHFGARGRFLGPMNLGPCERRPPGEPAGAVAEPSCPLAGAPAI